MCGIAGVVGERSPARLEAMLQTIAHRGPDDSGQEWLDAGGDRCVGLGSRRLAILDPSPAGHQPMLRRHAALVYNGEVYNFAELRRELQGAGEQFVSSTDTEVVLALLAREGCDALSRLNGMFALALWDERNRELVLARDRFGIKPLYYAVRGGELLFASEAKALLAGGITPRVAMDMLGSYLSFGYVPGSRTLFEGISEVPPGGLLRWRDGRVSIEAYRDVVPQPDDDISRADAAELLHEALTRSVARQLVSDFPVGILLSGGLDSSGIAALVARSGRTATGYVIGFRDEDGRLEQSPDDLQHARLVAREAGIPLEEIVVEPAVADLLPDVAWHLDDPVADPAAILTLLISRAAADHAKVLLSGHGSDELFAGYSIHLFDQLARPVARLPVWGRQAGLRGIDASQRLLKELPGALPGVALAVQRAAHSIVAHAALPPDRRYVAFRSEPYFRLNGASPLLTDDALSAASPDASHAVHLAAFADHPELRFFERMLYVDVKTYLVNQNLAYVDRLSMAASVELRVPFLDDEVVDAALRMPRPIKARGLRGKRVLRDALSGLVPEPVLRRRKAGFVAPVRAWLRSDLLPLVEDVLSEQWLRDSGFFRPGVVRQLVSEHTSGDADHTQRLWTLLAFALWHQTHVEKGH